MLKSWSTILPQAFQLLAQAGVQRGRFVEPLGATVQVRLSFAQLLERLLVLELGGGDLTAERCELPLICRGARRFRCALLLEIGVSLAESASPTAASCRSRKIRTSSGW